LWQKLKSNLDPHSNFGREEAVPRHEFKPNTQFLQPTTKKSGQNDTAAPASSRLKSIYGWSLLPGDTTFATNFGQKVMANSTFYAN
jgi:hypothetical protein